MKKLLCLFLTFVLVLGFTSCKAARGITTIDESTTESITSNDSNSNQNESSDDDNNESKSADGITPLVWKVTDNDSNGVLWLFGSIHTADKDIYPLPKQIINAYNSSNALAVECDITDKSQATQYLSYFVYSDGSTINKHISADLYNKAKVVLSDIYNEQLVKTLDYYKPIMWFTMINEAYLMETDLKSDYGIDKHFLDDAHKNNKKILEIESQEFQMKLLSGFSHELQEFILSEIVETPKDEFLDELYELAEAWKVGDTDIMDNLLNKIPEEYTAEQINLVDEYEKKLVTDRNIDMAEKAKEYLEDNMNVFYIVGALHMIGDGGIVQLLIDAGYKVEQVTY